MKTTYSRLNTFLKSRRRVSFFLYDLVLSGVSLWASLLIRYEGQIPPTAQTGLFSMLPWVILTRMFCFWGLGLYRMLWQYVSLSDFLVIVRAATVSSLVFLTTLFFFQITWFPRSALVIDWMFLTICMGGARILIRLIVPYLQNSFSTGKKKRVLIVGANDVGEMLAQEFARRPQLGYDPVGYLDDDPQKKGGTIHGLAVWGGSEKIAAVLSSQRIDEVIITAPNLSPEAMKRVFLGCCDVRIPCRIVPRAHSFFSASIMPLELRRVDVSDLLGRDLAIVDVEGIARFFHEKKVLITGGGGSIGSELARVVCRCKCAEIILVDFSENNLYEVQMDLKLMAPEQKVTAYLTDVCSLAEMEKIFETHKPHVVFHAAAHKQVPIVETHFLKGIRNNVLGTKTVADLSVQHGVDQFVLISTDKAIRPRSVMGTAKRVSELYLQSLFSEKTRLLTVRFGNVFNSRGSVIPLFRKQIAETRSVTLTDPEATRYFMDCTEAVFLILQAAIYGKSSEVFILDMGSPIKIIDLAYNLAKLMGVSPHELSVRYMGLRPGEKLAELIELDNEIAQETPNSKIKIWKTSGKPAGDFQTQVNRLLDLVSLPSSREEVVNELKKIVPEYEPWKAPSKE